MWTHFLQTLHEKFSAAQSRSQASLQNTQSEVLKKTVMLLTPHWHHQQHLAKNSGFDVRMLTVSWVMAATRQYQC